MLKHIYIDEGAISPVLHGADLKCPGVNAVADGLKCKDIVAVSGNNSSEIMIM
mgnify:CR=1 FL=1